MTLRRRALTLLAGLVIGGLLVAAIGAALVEDAAINGDFDICQCRWSR